MFPYGFRSDDRRPGGSIDWDAAVMAHQRWLRTVVASRLGEATAVDDVMQQIALAAARVELRPRDVDRVAPWLYRVAVRQCLQHRRTAGRRRRLWNRLAQGVEASGSEPAGEPLEGLLQRERQTAVQGALDELAAVDRQLLLLKYTEDWTYRQLAEHLGVGVHTIEYRLQLARDRLRNRLVQTGLLEIPQ